MIPDEKLKILLQEMSLRGKAILAKQSAISYADALQQVLLLKRISKVGQSSKKSRQNS